MIFGIRKVEHLVLCISSLVRSRLSTNTAGEGVKSDYPSSLSVASVDHQQFCLPPTPLTWLVLNPPVFFLLGPNQPVLLTPRGLDMLSRSHRESRQSSGDGGTRLEPQRKHQHRDTDPRRGTGCVHLGGTGASKTDTLLLHPPRSAPATGRVGHSLNTC